MREIVFDTETTGLDPYQGDRLVEIGCVELVNGFPTGKTFTTISIPSATCRTARSRCTACPPNFSRTSRILPISAKSSRLRRRCAAGRAQCDVRPRLHQRRARALQARAAAARPAGRHTDAGAAALSGWAEQPRLISARDFPSIPRAAPSMARCSMPSCSPKSMSN